MRTWAAIGLLCVSLSCLPAHADDDARNDPWSVSVYAGPATTKYVGAIVVSGFNYHPTSAAVGVDLDRRLIYLGGDLWIGADAQAAIYRFGHPDKVYGAGLGFLVDDPFGWENTKFSIYDGPSWDTDPPYISIGYKEKVHPAARGRFLNYVSFDFAVRLPHTEKWDLIAQVYHRSGMFGAFSIEDDESTIVGCGIRYRF
jgi:hypothetical protein